MQIFCQNPVAIFGESEESLENADRVLDLGRALKLGPIAGPLVLVDPPAGVTIPAIGEIGRPGVGGMNSIRLALLTLIAPPTILPPVRQGRQCQHIGRVRRRQSCMDKFCPAMDSDVHANAESPLPTLGHLVHLRIKRIVLTLGRTRRTDQSRIHDHAVRVFSCTQSLPGRRDRHLHRINADRTGTKRHRITGFAGIVTPPVLAAIFGHEWARAREMVVCMTAWFRTKVPAEPVPITLHVTNQQRDALALRSNGLTI
jgi:hypothetical protein